MSITFRFLIVFIFLTGGALAKDTNAGKGAPIQTKMTMGLFGILGANMEYSYNGKKLENYRDFQNVIYPLGDAESARMIHEAEEAEFVWWMLLVTGVAAGVDVALAYKPVPFLNVDWIDRISTGTVAIQIFLAPGIIIGAIGASDKFNAVQRYNSLVRGEEKKALSFSPRLVMGHNRLGLGLEMGF